MAYYLNHDFLKEAPLKNKLYLKLKLNKFSNIIRKCRRYFEKQSNNHIRTDLIPFCESTLDEQSENFNKDHYCFIQNIFERNFYEIILNNYNRAKILLNRLLIQLSEDSEEYNLVINKIKEINK